MMKMALKTVFVILTMVGCTSGEKEFLFNGQDLDNWVIYTDDASVNPDSYYYVKDGFIENTGVPMGYMRTKKSYSNYRLHVEWRYPEKPTNSGILLHAFGPDAIWIKHYQAQLKYMKAGDFIINAVDESAQVGDSLYVSTEEVKELIPKMHESNEYEAGGEWNSYDIVCKDNTIKISVNGLLQNVASNCSRSEGYIGLQAEGSKIQFRNIWIKKIK